MTHERGKSDTAVRAMKPANKAERSAAELVEQRAVAKGNADQQSTRRAQERESVSQALGHRDSPQDCHAVLQCAASRYGLRRSGGIILRDPLSGAGCQKSTSACQGLRIHSSSSRDAGRRAGRFLGKRRRISRGSRGEIRLYRATSSGLANSEAMPGAQSQRQRLSPTSSAADGRNWSTAAWPPDR